MLRSTENMHIEPKTGFPYILIRLKECTLNNDICAKEMISFSLQTKRGF